jgi:hypothetical protein
MCNEDARIDMYLAIDGLCYHLKLQDGLMPPWSWSSLVVGHVADAISRMASR